MLTLWRLMDSNLPTEARLRLFESIVIHANGAVMMTEAEPVAYPGPRIFCYAHWISLQRDITARKRQEAALHRSETFFPLGLVHEQLMESPDLKTFDIVPFLERLSRNFIDGGGKAGVEMEVQTCALQIGLDFAVPLGLLVTKPVTNSLKHVSLPDREGHIPVSLSDEPAGRLCLTVSDSGLLNGPGPEGKAKKPGLGTNIIRSLVTQLEGQTDVKTDGGTSGDIRMPMPVTL